MRSSKSLPIHCLLTFVKSVDISENPVEILTDVQQCEYNISGLGLYGFGLWISCRAQLEMFAVRHFEKQRVLEGLRLCADFPGLDS